MNLDSIAISVFLVILVGIDNLRQAGMSTWNVSFLCKMWYLYICARVSIGWGNGKITALYISLYIYFVIFYIFVII